ncbi:ATP-dependent helicase [Chloroflexota bacterium]
MTNVRLETAITELEWLKNLNPQQLEAVTHADGPLLVVAGAGSGKTRTLAYRVAYLISQGVRPESILLLTFTRRAAEEMLKRAASAIPEGFAGINHVWGGTFHATANRILRIYAPSAGLSPDFTIIDRSDAEDFLDVIRHEMSFSKSYRRFPRKSTCMEIYSRRINGDEDLENVLKKYFPWCQMWEPELKQLFRKYVDRKQKQDVLDYDDLLLYLYQLLQDDVVAESLGSRFDHILVDEYQDTNRIQAGILAGMRRQNSNIMVVGDDAQSIYSFRSATVRNMLDFPSQFPGTTIIPLEQNYRSTKSILETTNRVVAQASERYSKEIWSERRGGQRPQMITCVDEYHQDEEVIRRVLEHYEQGIPLRKQAVLFRASSHSSSLELALTRKNIPFRKYGGLRFLEAAHIKDLVSILRILENPRDEIAWFRVLQLLSGIGPVTAASVFQHVADNGYDPRALATFHTPPAARDEMAGLVSLVKDLVEIQDESPAVQIDRIRRFYDPILDRTYENAGPRANDIEHLGELASRYRSRREFLADLVLEPPISTGDFAGSPILDEDWLVLSTIHSAKGLEWDTVFLIHAADGCLPSDMATGDDEDIEEELRLTYVAMTRARDFLYVLWPLRFYSRTPGRLTDGHTYAQCSRFFTKQVLRTMDKVVCRELGMATDVPMLTSDGKEIASRIRDMWK